MAEPSKRSKKQSSGRQATPSLLEPEFVIYLDENLHNCKPIIEVLQLKEVRFERHGAYFPDGTHDTVWLPFVGTREWVILSKDKRFRYNEYERQSVNRYKVREFFYACGSINKYDMADILGAVLPEMKKFCSKHKPPFVASITKEKRIHLRYGGAERTG